ncbi:putative het-domain-containing protein [Botrytis fragariae]|uniref:Putative het-domain-containing protein n=1 Tax=Botrytis fragariae TaxID=1964551 RepID=A0A8H6EHW4_9HELO|nr:putative het-domain-containing protein [Botrytis fragariae]KAF5872490.1 putative het-domain-containing protein [Botrytis fragariae]
MSAYPYSLLPANGEIIRLLRLLPSEDEAAPLHCELQDYSLRRSTTRAHLYEALSYVWGDPDITLPIFVGKKKFQVTVNLYAALLRLRDHSFERILWVDAICIDQNNNEERRQQVRIMAKIYSSAHRVIVWLGDEEEEGKGALEDIQLAIDEEYTENSEIRREMVKQEKISKLLQNPWFQRIWVLQEVAAARHIIIMCGSITIDGYAFCMGVKSLELSCSDSPGLQTLPSVVDIIEGAGLRPKLEATFSERFSLEIRSLAELIDMFHTRRATDRRDKVYALLGMSSDDPEKAGLQPSYEASWEDVFQQVVNFILGKDITVSTSSQRAVIQCKGLIFGQVSSVRMNDGQHVSIKSRLGDWDLSDITEWTLQASAKPIQEHDIICLIYGASKPTIIRLCHDHYIVIVIAATPLNVLTRYDWPQVSQSKTQFLRDFLLIWDWENSYEVLQDQEGYRTLTKTYSQTIVFPIVESRGYLHEATRLWNNIAILEDLKEYEKADERLLEARSGYMAAFEKGPLLRPIGEGGRTLLSFAAGEGHEDVVKLLLGKVDPDIKDSIYEQTPLSFAAENGHQAIVKLLLATGQVEADSTDNFDRTPLCWAAKEGHESAVKLLLAIDQVEVESKDKKGRTPLGWAAKEGRESVVKLLLLNDRVEVDSRDKKGRTPLCWAAKEGHESVVELLLATGQVEADSKGSFGKKPLSLAAENGHEAVVKLLLATGQVEINSKDNFDRTALFYATRNGHAAIAKLLKN